MRETRNIFLGRWEKPGITLMPAYIVVKYTLDESHTSADHVAVGSDTYKFKMQSASRGTHIGEKGWNIAATLEVLDRDKLIKEYTAVAFAEGHGRFGDTLTEMREKPS